MTSWTGSRFDFLLLPLRPLPGDREEHVVERGSVHGQVPQRNLFGFEELAGNTEAALLKYDAAVGMMAGVIGEEHPHTIKPRLAAARIRLQQGDFADAEQRYERALAVMETNRREVPRWDEYTEPYLAALVGAGRQADADAFRARLETVRSQVIWPQSD